MAVDRHLRFTLNGSEIEVPDRGDSLLGVLRSDLGLTSPKDGCSPQGQCGCCTVLVDGKPRVACVTPARRIANRSITTLEGLERRDLWLDTLSGCGGAQCGFCTPGIVCRLDPLVDVADRDAAVSALSAHLCRCTGWQPITESYEAMAGLREHPTTPRNLEAAAIRAELEGGVAQQVGPHVAAGGGPFSADHKGEHLVCVLDADGRWHHGETLAEARSAAAKTQGRRTTEPPTYPVAVPGSPPAGAATLQTTWVEPAYLETDSVWCEPGGEPSSALGNGGAFGAKSESALGDAARRLADELGSAVLCVYTREDTVRLGPKRPPCGGWVDAGGRGRLDVAQTAGIAQIASDAATRLGLALEVAEVDVAGPPTSSSIRAAGWAEVYLLARAAGVVDGWVDAPNGGAAWAEATPDGIAVRVRPGTVLDEAVLRSYCIGAAHMGWSWVMSESLSVSAAGDPLDLTIRSFGITKAGELPPVTVSVEADDGPAVAVSDAVFVAVAAAAWTQAGSPQRLPVGG